jgi:hypothetical protein
MLTVTERTKSLRKLGLVLFVLSISFFSNSAQAQWADTCQHLREWGAYHPTDKLNATRQYDTLRLYIERCASDQISYGYFSDISTAAYYMSDDIYRLDSCRAWLISVLYLNTNQEEYFCACMGAIYSTYRIGKYQVVGGLAVMDWLRKNHPECWDSQGDKEYSVDSNAAAQGGYDVIHLPPLDSLGLGFLLKASAPSPTTVELSYLTSLTSSPNPFKNETHLRFHLNRMAYTTIGIYDELGHQVWGDGNGHPLEAGDHDVSISAGSLPEGLLYARVSTGFGEVRTIKLVHE